jgi:Bacteriophage lambda head decoration protein D
MPTLTEPRYEGEFMGELALGTAYHFDQVTLVSGQNLAAGTVVAIIAASGKFTAYDNASGTANIAVAAGILVGAVNASGGDVTTARVLRRGPSIVNGNDLNWGSNDATGVTAGKADLLALGIKVV